jgi:hypothetical protein
MTTDAAALDAHCDAEDRETLGAEIRARVCDVLRCEVLHQADEIERRTAELSTATGEIARLRAALAEAHAIIEGRTVAPTDAEIVAHWRAGGTWIVEGVIVLRVVEAVCAHRDQASWAAVTWLPLDRSRRPCAWPVVEARHG